MSVFLRNGVWVSKFSVRNKQRWTPGGPFPTREAALEAEEKYRKRLKQATEQAKERRKNAEAKPHAVYLLYAGDKIIYVGLTGAGVRRMSEHRQLRSWWTEITRAEFLHFDGFAAAELEESRLIRKLLPPGNGRGKGRATTPPGRPLPAIPLEASR